MWHVARISEFLLATKMSQVRVRPARPVRMDSPRLPCVERVQRPVSTRRGARICTDPSV